MKSHKAENCQEFVQVSGVLKTMPLQRSTERIWDLQPGKRNTDSGGGRWNDVGRESEYSLSLNLLSGCHIRRVSYPAPEARIVLMKTNDWGHFKINFMATSMAYGRSQARGRVRAAAASQHHSHSNAGSEPCLWPTPQLMAVPDPQPTERGQGSNPQPRGS